MKLAELKKEMKEADRADLEQTLYDLYKSLTPKSRESMSEFVRFGLHGIHPMASSQKKTPKPVNVQEIEEEFLQFKQDAQAGEYIKKRGSVIPKAEKGKWRLLVKRWIKELTSLSADSPDFEQAADLLFDLMRLIEDLSTRGTMPGDHVFQSIGYSPKELARTVFGFYLKKYSGNDQMTWEDLIDQTSDHIWLSESESNNWFDEGLDGEYMALVCSAQSNEDKQALIDAILGLDSKRKSDFRWALIALYVSLGKYEDAMNVLLDSPHADFILEHKLNEHFRWMRTAEVSKENRQKFFEYIEKEKPESIDRSNYSIEWVLEDLGLKE